MITQPILDFFWNCEEDDINDENYQNNKVP
jgi:hypothetical protein